MDPIIIRSPPHVMTHRNLAMSVRVTITTQRPGIPHFHRLHFHVAEREARPAHVVTHNDPATSVRVIAVFLRPTPPTL